MYLLVLETSTSAAKALLYHSETGVVAVESCPYPPKMNENGRQDTEGIFLATMEAGRKVAAGKEVAAVAVGGVWHSIAICGADGKPAAPTYAWTFTGASDLCRQAREDAELSKRMYTRTGCMPNVTYQPYTLRYLAQNGLNLSDKLLFSQAGYNFFRMTGERMETDSIVSGMGLLNIHQRRYDEEALAYAGIRETQLSPLGDYHQTRPLGGECAGLLGISPGIPVVPPYSDGALNQLGNGAIRPGIMTFSVGTSAAIRLTTPRPILSDPPGTWCYVGVQDWMSGAATAGACNCVNWFKESMMQDKWSFAQLEETLLDDGDTPVFLPFLFGERCPGWQDERRGGFALVDSSATAPRMFQAICEGILFNVYHCYQILTALSGTPDEIVMSGGILNSPKWTQLAADIFGCPISLSTEAQASMLGGAVLAMHAGGAIRKLEDFSDASRITVHPRPGLEELYRRKFERYLDCYDARIRKRG